MRTQAISLQSHHPVVTELMVSVPTRIETGAWAPNRPEFRAPSLWVQSPSPPAANPTRPEVSWESWEKKRFTTREWSEIIAEPTIEVPNFQGELEITLRIQKTTIPNSVLPALKTVAEFSPPRGTAPQFAQAVYRVLHDGNGYAQIFSEDRSLDPANVVAAKVYGKRSETDYDLYTRIEFPFGIGGNAYVIRMRETCAVTGNPSHNRIEWTLAPNAQAESAYGLLLKDSEENVFTDGIWDIEALSNGKVRISHYIHAEPKNLENFPDWVKTTLISLANKMAIPVLFEKTIRAASSDRYFTAVSEPAGAKSGN